MRKALLASLAVVCCGALFGQDKGKLSILVYADYFYNVQRDSAIASFPNAATGGSKSSNGFQFRRIYFTYDYAIASDIASRFRLEADESALTSDGKIGMFVKDAYVQWKNVFGRTNLMFGIQPTPAFEVSEGVWGYRSLQKTILDLRGMVGSRDFGVSLRGTVGESGSLGYWLMVGNGTGNRPEADKLKRVYGHVRVQATEMINITLYGDYNTRTDITNPFTSARVGNSTLTTAAFVGITPAGRFRFGLEGALQSSASAFNTGTSLDTRDALGISAFLGVVASANLEFVARYDHYDPNMNGNATGDSRGYFLAGLDWTAGPNVHVIPNLQLETYESSAAGQSYDPSVTGRVTVVWSLP